LSTRLRLSWLSCHLHILLHRLEAGFEAWGSLTTLSYEPTSYLYATSHSILHSIIKRYEAPHPTESNYKENTPPDPANRSGTTDKESPQFVENEQTQDRSALSNPILLTCTKRKRAVSSSPHACNSSSKLWMMLGLQAFISL
jgi:hypothetical protein